MLSIGGSRFLPLLSLGGGTCCYSAWFTLWKLFKRHPFLAHKLDQKYRIISLFGLFFIAKIFNY